ncbi:MAG: FAD-binding oxidoreductase [Acidiferrobacterales bacterium]|nr:FAD-binding oxidoreductase [Acidiferrobacterales bacterium]
MTEPIFAEKYKSTSYWWDENPPMVGFSGSLPHSADVVVIGAGYTGLAAALETARAGLHTVVVDAEQAGWGCSSRNGGQVSGVLKPGFASLSKRYGREQAAEILREGHNARTWIEQFVINEKLDCDFKVVGKFRGAHTSSQFRKLAKSIDRAPKELVSDAVLVPRSEQHAEIGSDFYHGGIVHPKHASVNPGKLHNGFLQRVIAAGAIICDDTRVLETVKRKEGIRVVTNRGNIRARKVIVATNGYTNKALPWLQRRVIPIGSYIIATEELDLGLMNQLIPKDRMHGDTRRLVYYYRASPDRKRILFGGRVSLSESNPTKTGPKLHQEMVRIFPPLSNSKISYTWMGIVGYTFDSLPHIGQHNGLHYAMGYCGSGIAMSGYLGTRVAQQVLEREEGRTAFDQLQFQTRPLYNGHPWFLSASVMAYRLYDRLGV